METTVALLASQPCVGARPLQQQLLHQRGVTVPTRMAYQSRDEIVDNTNGNVYIGFQSLESLLNDFKEKNPTCAVAFSTEGDGEFKRFKRAFLSCPYAAEIQQRSQRVLGIDGAFMKY